jgi:hypothetical protein
LSLYYRGGDRFGKERYPVPQAIGAVFDPVTGFFNDLNESSRTIGTRFTLADPDAAIIEVQADIVVCEVLSGDDARD